MSDEVKKHLAGSEVLRAGVLWAACGARDFSIAERDETERGKRTP
jgi:hypothetical protein